MREQPRCPYTLLPLAELDTSVEHVVPHALGGSAAYAVTASQELNSRLGRDVDGPFVDDFIVAGMRTRLGVASRSGVASWRLRGRDEEGRDVELRLTPDALELRLRQPVERKGDRLVVIVDPAERDEELQRIARDLARKGKELVTTGEAAITIGEVRVDTAIDVNALRLGLLKIAYLAAFRTIGDDFLDEPIATSWRQAILGDGGADALDSIHGTAFETGTRDVLLPRLRDSEHGIIVANLEGSAFVSVSLFGGAVLNLLAPLDSTHLPGGSGEVAVCDATARSCSIVPVLAHIESLAT